MTPTEYTAALTTLSLTPEQAAAWLGIGRSTAYRYLKTGCEGPVVVAIRERLARSWRTIDTAPDADHPVFVVKAFDVVTCSGHTYTGDPVCTWRNLDGTFARWGHDFQPTHWLPIPKHVRHSDLTAAVGVGS